MHWTIGAKLSLFIFYTDVVVILVGTFHSLITIQPSDDILVTFWMGKNDRFYHISTICASSGPQQSRALPAVHAFSACHTFSVFNGKGKNLLWQAWLVYLEVTDTLVYLADHPFQQLNLDNSLFHKLEGLTVIMYNNTSPLTCVNQTRCKLFYRRNRTMDKLSRTKDALLQHVRCAVYQPGIWTVSCSCEWPKR